MDVDSITLWLLNWVNLSFGTRIQSLRESYRKKRIARHALLV